MTFTRRQTLHLMGGAGLVGVAGCLDLLRSCDPACFEGEYESWDDTLSTMTITHDGGESLPANELYITGVADEFPPDPEEGRTRPWYEVSDFGPDQMVEEGDSIKVEVGFVDVVQLLWRHDGEEELLEEFNAN